MELFLCVALIISSCFGNVVVSWRKSWMRRRYDRNAVRMGRAPISFERQVFKQVVEASEEEAVKMSNELKLFLRENPHLLANDLAKFSFWSLLDLNTCVWQIRAREKTPSRALTSAEIEDRYQTNSQIATVICNMNGYLGSNQCYDLTAPLYLETHFGSDYVY